MQISFGKIKEVIERKSPINRVVSKEQQYAAKYAIRAFAPNPNIPFRYGSDPNTGLEYSLDEALKKKKNADVYIIHKLNGNIELRVMKMVPGTEALDKPKYYVPAESYTNKLKIEVNPRLPLKRLNEIFRKFSKRCEYYVRTGESKINKKTEEEIRTSLGIGKK